MKKKVERDAFKLIKDGKELYSHTFDDREDFFGAVFIKSLNCYFLLVNKTLYRKDINTTAPSIFMDIPYKLGDFQKFLLHDPSLGQKVVIVSKSSAKMVSLPQKKIILCTELLTGFTYQTERMILEAKIFGKEGEKLAVSNQPSKLTMIDQRRRKVSIFEEDSIGERVASKRVNARIGVSKDNRFIFSLLFRRKFMSPFLGIFEVKGDKIHQKMELLGDEVKEVISGDCRVIFLGQSEGSYVLAAFSGKNEKNVVPLVYDSKENTLEALDHKRVKLGLEYPATFEKHQNEVYAVGLKLKISKISISN